MEINKATTTEVQLPANESIVFEAKAAKGFRWKMTLRFLGIYGVIMPLIALLAYYLAQSNDPNFYSELSQSLTLDPVMLNFLFAGFILLLIVAPSLFWGFFSAKIRYYCTNLRCIYFNKLAKNLRQVSVPYQEISSVEKYQDWVDRRLDIFTVIIWLRTNEGKSRKPLLISGLSQQDAGLLMTTISQNLATGSILNALIPKLDWKDKQIFPQLNWKKGIFAEGENTPVQSVWPYILYYMVISIIFFALFSFLIMNQLSFPSPLDLNFKETNKDLFVYALIFVISLRISARIAISAFYTKYGRFFNKAEYVKVSWLVLIYGVILGIITTWPAISDLNYQVILQLSYPYFRLAIVSFAILLQVGITALLVKFIFKRTLARMYYRLK